MPVGVAGAEVQRGSDGGTEAFGENGPLTAGVVAEEAPDLHKHAHEAANAGQISDRALVAAMDAARRCGTERTAGGRGRHTGAQTDGVLVNFQRIQTEAGHRR